MRKKQLVINVKERLPFIATNSKTYTVAIQDVKHWLIAHIYALTHV